VSVIWRKPVLAYSVGVIIDGFGEFGEYCWCTTYRWDGSILIYTGSLRYYGRYHRASVICKAAAKRSST